jgi:hypothetical protein
LRGTYGKCRLYKPFFEITCRHRQTAARPFSDRTSQRFVFLPELKRGAIPRIVCGASGFVFACWYRKNRRTLLRGMLQLFW